MTGVQTCALPIYTAFAPISLVAINPQILTSHVSLPVKTARDLIALARVRPGQIIYSSAGVGATSHMATELFLNMAKVKMSHVPYKGGGPSFQALMSGETALSFVDAITVAPHAKAGRLRALATSTLKRTPLMPEIPTVHESGLPNFESVTSFGMFAPTGTPRDIIGKVHREVTRALASSDVKDKLKALGVDPVGSTPEELVTHQKQETAKWGKVVREQGIKFE